MLSADAMILCIKDSKNFMKKLVQLRNTFTKDRNAKLTNKKQLPSYIQMRIDLNRIQGNEAFHNNLKK